LGIYEENAIFTPLHRLGLLPPLSSQFSTFFQFPLGLFISS
jgi:hypothetical protein